MAHCHSNSVVHNDIKPDNLLFKELDPVCPWVVVSDFGQASTVSAPSRNFGDPRYVPPESWQGTECVAAGSMAGDVWMIGVTLFELLSAGILPFFENSNVTLDVFKAWWTHSPMFAVNYIAAVQNQDPNWHVLARVDIGRRSDPSMHCISKMLAKQKQSRVTCA